MRVLLTGATGFIGSYVARELLERTCEVGAVLRPHSDTWRIRELLPRLTVLEGDLEERADLDLADFAPDLVVHLAWYCAPADYRYSPRNAGWIDGGLRLAQAAVSAGCKRILMAGTCFEYRIGAGVLAEDSPIEPINLYAAAKWSLYNLAERYCAAHECSLVWPRLFYLYGPMENQKRLVPYVIRNLLEGRRCPLTAGHQVRDFLHVSDVARAICEAALSSVEGPVNVGSGTPVTVAEVSREIGRQIGREELLEFGAQPTLAGDPGFICADSRRLRSETGWRPRHDLASGVRDTVEWWRARIQETDR